MGALPDAAISFEKAIELGSQLPQHYYWAGYAQIELGDCQRALAYLDTGRRIALQRGATRYLADIEAIISECDSSFVSGSPAG